MALAAAERFDYNFIEAFDQNWKYADEGIVGANWGLFTAERDEGIPPSGALREDPFWPLHAGFSVVCGLILAAIASAGGAARSSQVVLLAMTLGAALGLAQADAAPVLYDGHVRLAAAVNLGGQALLAVLTMLRLSGAVRPAPYRTGGQATARVINLLRLRRPAWPGLFEDLLFLFTWAAAVDQVLLVFDPRYRDFPIASYAVPLVVIAARFAQRDLPANTGRREEALLATVLTVGAVASAVQEGALNRQSLAWNACALVLTVPLWTSLMRAQRPMARCR